MVVAIDVPCIDFDCMQAHNDTAGLGSSSVPGAVSCIRGELTCWSSVRGRLHGTDECRLSGVSSRENTPHIRHVVLDICCSTTSAPVLLLQEPPCGLWL